MCSFPLGTILSFSWNLYGDRADNGNAQIFMNIYNFFFLKKKTDEPNSVTVVVIGVVLGEQKFGKKCGCNGALLFDPS